MNSKCKHCKYYLLECGGSDFTDDCQFSKEDKIMLTKGLISPKRLAVSVEKG